MIKIGLVGFGSMGRVHLSNYRHLEDCSVTAVCSMSSGKEDKAELKGVRLYTDIADMLANEQLDVVDVCTPTFAHFGHVSQALKSGVHVICEKPLALTGADARELYRLAEQSKVQLFVGQVLQFSPQALLLRRLVKNGDYGKVIDASFLRLSACPRWAKDGWLFEKEKSGLIPFDLHIHDLDLIVSLFGKPSRYSVTSGGRNGLSYQEHCRFFYKFPGLNVCAEAGWLNADIPFTASWRVCFENAVVENDGNRVIAYQFDNLPYVFNTDETIEIPTGINLPPTGMFYHELAFFLERIRTASGSEPYRKEEILTVVDILEDMNRHDCNIV